MLSVACTLPFPCRLRAFKRQRLLTSEALLQFDLNTPDAVFYLRIIYVASQLIQMAILYLCTLKVRPVALPLLLLLLHLLLYYWSHLPLKCFAHR